MTYAGLQVMAKTHSDFWSGWPTESHIHSQKKILKKILLLLLTIKIVKIRKISTCSSPRFHICLSVITMDTLNKVLIEMSYTIVRHKYHIRHLLTTKLHFKFDTLVSTQI